MNLDLLEHAAATVCAAARQSGQRTGISLRGSSEEGLDAARLFATATARGEERFFASRPADDHEWLGLGCAALSLAHGSDALAQIRTDVDDWRASWLGDVDELRIVGNVAFRGRPALEQEAAWRSFGSARFVVPRLLWRRDADGQRMVVSFTALPEDDPQSVLRRVVAHLEQTLQKDPDDGLAQTGARPQPSVPPPGFEQAAVRVVDAIREGRAEKVVLAGAIDRELAQEPAFARILRDLTREHPGALTFALGHDQATFLGVTPEVLVRRSARQVEAAAVAGTARRHADPAADETSAKELLASCKDAVEHQLVVQAIQDALRPFARLEPTTAPSLIDAGPVRHLYTRVRGELTEERHLLELAAELHPTPALGGVPAKAALELIDQVESFDRGGYGGPLGWFSFEGCGEFDVALRCALLRGRKARLYAGSGLVAASRPDAEARETADKLRSVGDWLETP